MLRIHLVFLLSLLPAAACLWDRDTLREEAKGRLDTVRATVGWFDRYPARYYEMRLERVAKELEARPADLNLHDDAGVACSRLGRQDEAIAWMKKKKAVLDTMPETQTADDRYRYLSNLGTFHLIRWIMLPEERRSANLSDLQTSESLIARALELNPGAHFGREEYQLRLIRWLLDPEPPEANYYDPNFLSIEANSQSAPHSIHNTPGIDYEKARKGITGLIQLGAAWESIDTFQTLRMCLHCDQMALLAHLAYLREKELHDGGARSLHPNPEIRERIVPLPANSFHGVERIDRFYHATRTAAKERENSWLAYQEQRFQQGMHPDTHPDFWKKWKEPDFPRLPGATLWQIVVENIGLFLLLSCIAAIGILIALIKVTKKLLSVHRERSSEAIG